MNLKIIPIMLCIISICQCNIVFADNTEAEILQEQFNPNITYAKYKSFSRLNNWGNYYAVENYESINNKAIFCGNVQITEFVYNYIIFDPYFNSIIVAKNVDGVDNYGLLDASYILDEEYLTNSDIRQRLPLEYKMIEFKDVRATCTYIATDFNDNEEYYLIKKDFLTYKEMYNNSAYDIEYEEVGNLIKINSFDDVPDQTYGSKDMISIEGLDGCYVLSDGSGFYVDIVDENGNPLIDMKFRKVDNKLSKGDMLIVYYPEGMGDLSAGVLNKDLEVIVPRDFYSDVQFIEDGKEIYILVTNFITDRIDYYDINGNLVDYNYISNNKQTDTNVSYSSWAEESIIKAIDLNIVPEDLRSNYVDKITRKEFCKLAVQTYITKTGVNIDLNIKSPFTDVDDGYITAAYNLKIVEGVGNNKFAPDNNITRQEAAVMLNNLANVLGYNTKERKAEKFVDESYFAEWAKDAIYTVSAIKSGDTYIMAGTGNGKFSPWMNYTREQAISTMYRIYNTKAEVEQVSRPSKEIIPVEVTSSIPLYRKKENGLWGYINDKNEWIIEPQYEYAEAFVGEYALTDYGSARSTQIINKQGETLAGGIKYISRIGNIVCFDGSIVNLNTGEKLKDYPEDFVLFGTNYVDMTIPVKDDTIGLYGYYKQNGEMLTTKEYQEAYIFHNNKSVVKKNGKYKLINEKGVIVSDIDIQLNDGEYVKSAMGDVLLIYKDTDDYSYSFKVGKGQILKAENERSTVDFIINGDLIIMYYSKDYEWVYSLYNNNGELIISPDKNILEIKYDVISDIYLVRYGSYINIIDNQGNVIYKLNYGENHKTNFCSISNDIFCVWNDRAISVYNNSGKLMSEITVEGEISEVYSDNGVVLITNKDNEFNVYTHLGKKLI